VSKQKAQLEQLLEIRSKELEQARSLAFNWVETVASNKSEERSRFYLDSLKENLGLPDNVDIQQLLHQTPPSMGKQEPPKREMIEQQLAVILNSKGFLMAKRMRGLLQFIVEETLDGHASTLKAFTIAVEVFQRDERFDPQQDPLIRVQAGNLRKRLEQYYLTDGRQDKVIINIPKGSYGAVFTTRN
jgi:hypothetical protein